MMKEMVTDGCPQKPENWTTAAHLLTEPDDLVGLAMYLARDLGPADDFQLPKPLRRHRSSDQLYLTPRVQAVVDLYLGDGRNVPPRNAVRGVAIWAFKTWKDPVLEAALPEAARAEVDREGSVMGAALAASRPADRRKS